MSEGAMVVLEAPKEVLEGFSGKEADVFSEEGEEAALEEKRDDLRVVLLFFERGGQACEGRGDLTGDHGRVLGGIERVRVGEDGVEKLPFAFVSEIVEKDAVLTGDGEGGVGAAGAREISIEFEDITNVTDNEEGRDVFFGREVSNVAAGLFVGAFEGFVPGLGLAGAVAAGSFGRGDLGEALEERLSGIVLIPGRVDALFGFQDEMAGLVEIKKDGGLGPVLLGSWDGALENVVILRCFRLRRVRARNTEEFTEFNEEELTRPSFVAPGRFPFRDEFRSCEHYNA